MCSLIWHVFGTTGDTTAEAMACRWQRDKRSFGNIRRLPSGRYQVRFTAPDGSYVTAPQTFAARIDAEAFAGRPAPQIDTMWDATAVTDAERDHVRRLRRGVAGGPAGRRSPDQGPHPGALPRDPRRPPAAGVRHPPARRDQAEGCPRLARQAP